MLEANQPTGFFAAHCDLIFEVS